MPIYEYRCTKGHSFDLMQRFSDEPLSKCQICGAAAQRVMHAPAVHFKGSGFYNTDYGTRNRSREMKEAKEGSTSESSASGEKSGDSKSDSKLSDSSAKSESANGSDSKGSESSRAKAKARAD